MGNSISIAKNNVFTNLNVSKHSFNITTTVCIKSIGMIRIQQHFKPEHNQYLHKSNSCNATRIIKPRIRKLLR